MNKRVLLITILIYLFTSSVTAQNELLIDLNKNKSEKWWGALVALGDKMPFEKDLKLIDLAYTNMNNQHAPMLISSAGRYMWSESPFTIEIKEGVMKVRSEKNEIVIQQSKGKTLRDAYLAIAEHHFSFNGAIPEQRFFSEPQYNTWIELMYNQNQSDIMRYAGNILKYNFPKGILMIDDNWQRYYGNFDFRQEKFPDAKGMIDSLHRMGFKVMVWIAPYVSADSPEFRDLRRKGYLIKKKGSNEPKLFFWWNGYSACYDLTNPDAFKFLESELKRCQQTYGVDGFKFDAGDVDYFRADFELHKPNGAGIDITQAWAELASRFEYNELRATWKMGGYPLVQRLGDKDYSWGAVCTLIPQMCAAALMGYPYTCPDMIGGGQFGSFLNIKEDQFDQKLIVRSAQIHALMPMMQFSVAPWRILNAENRDICAKMVKLHESFGPYILEMAKKCATTREPIVRHLEYSFPNQGFSDCKDQFMLGDKYLVAPVVTKSDSRMVRLPKGVWVDDLGKRHKGGVEILIDVPIDRLPYFERIK